MRGIKRGEVRDERTVEEHHVIGEERMVTVGEHSIDLSTRKARWIAPSYFSGEPWNADRSFEG
jgi:hypothetical protein